VVTSLLAKACAHPLPAKRSCAATALSGLSPSQPGKCHFGWSLTGTGLGGGQAGAALGGPAEAAEAAEAAGGGDGGGWEEVWGRWCGVGV